jgi:hypothetical protein
MENSHKPTAQHIDELRVFPRLILAFYMYLSWQLFEWASGLPDLSIQ